MIPSRRDTDTDAVLEHARQLRLKLDQMTSTLDEFVHALQDEVMWITEDEGCHEPRPDPPPS